MGQPAPAPGLFKALPCIFNEWLSCQEAGRLVHGERDRILMCVFKGENREVVITVSTDTVIRKRLLPWQMI